MFRQRRIPLAPAALCVALALAPAGLGAQIIFPVDSLERWLGAEDFEVGETVGNRFAEDRTLRAVLHLSPERSVMVKWARAPRDGEEFNNVPRYELAAYELQKLFLDPSDYVVPPTVLRAFPLWWYRTHVNPEAEATFDEAESVLAVISYWLVGVEVHEEADMERFERDEAYAYHLANCNVLTHLIDHKDANVGNFLISRRTEEPRVFSVDNGVAFGSRVSNRGDWWRRLRVDRLPRATVERLRGIDRQALERALAVLVQYEVRDGQLVPVEPGPRLGRRGVRKEDGVIQLGLTPGEIDEVEERIEELLEEVDEGDIELF